LCRSGIDQPSITYGPGYFKTRKEPVVIMQEAGGKNQSFHGRLFNVFNLWEKCGLYTKTGSLIFENHGYEF
jgi:hypothetical protein